MATIIDHTVSAASDTLMENYETSLFEGIERNDYFVEAASDTIKRENDGGWPPIFVSATPGNNEQTVTIRARTVGTAAGDVAVAYARATGNDGSDVTAYEVRFSGNAGAVFMYKVVSGSHSFIDSASITGFSASTFYDVSLSVVDNGANVDWEILVDDVSLLTGTDSSSPITAVGQAAFGIEDQNAEIAQITAVDTTSSGSAFTPMWRRRRAA